jgi:hypothetical protein
MLYFYAPSFTFTGPDEAPCFCPGVQVGDAIEEAPLPPGTRSPWFDRDLPRFVVALPAGSVAPGAGWEAKTAAEVLADYPNADM